MLASQTNNDQPEILNLHYHRILLIVKALNRSENQEQASAKLGLHARTIRRSIRDYGIVVLTNDGQHKKQYANPPDMQKRFLKQIA